MMYLNIEFSIRRKESGPQEVQLVCDILAGKDEFPKRRKIQGTPLTKM